MIYLALKIMREYHINKIDNRIGEKAVVTTILADQEGLHTGALSVDPSCNNSISNPRKNIEKSLTGV